MLTACGARYSDLISARLVLRLRAALACKRRAWATAGDALARFSATVGVALPVSLPAESGAVETAVLTALAGRYGPALLDTPELAFVLRAIAVYGGLRVAQQALWGTRVAEVALRWQLADALPALAQVAATHEVVFYAEAREALARFHAVSL